MVDTSGIRPHMEVLGSDGVHIGTVDHLDGARIKLSRRDSNDGEHHYVPVSDVVRVDAHVHVATTAAALGLLAAAGVTGAVADHGTAPFPPVRNIQAHGRPRGNFYLPWLLAVVGLVLLLLLFRSCGAHDDPVATTTTTTTSATAPAATAALPVEAVALPGGQTVRVAPNTLNYELQRYLAGNAATPRTFTFDKLNFDTGSAAIRAEDGDNVAALAQILAAYPGARVTITGYTDAEGGAGANAQLGQQRADAVARALGARGVGADRVATASGGEGKPTDSNATAGGRFDNRRSELTVTAK